MMSAALCFYAFALHVSWLRYIIISQKHVYNIIWIEICYKL